MFILGNDDCNLIMGQLANDDGDRLKAADALPTAHPQPKGVNMLIYRLDGGSVSHWFKKRFIIWLAHLVKSSLIELMGLRRSACFYRSWRTMIC